MNFVKLIVSLVKVKDLKFLYVWCKSVYWVEMYENFTILVRVLDKFWVSYLNEVNRLLDVSIIKLLVVYWFFGVF